MQKRSLVTLAVLLMMSAVQARTLDTIKASGTIIFATSADFKPFNYMDKDKLTGFEVELAEAIAAQMNLKPVWTVRAFQKLLSEVNTDPNGIDVVIASHAITSTRLKVVDFSNAHYCTGGVIVSRPGGPQTSRQLERRTVTSQVGSTYQGFVRKLPFEVHSLPVPGDGDAMDKVVKQEADAAVTDLFAALAYSQANPQAKLQISQLLWQESEGMAFAKGNKELRDAVNVALAEVVKNGTYNRLSQKYFGQNIKCGK